MWLVTIRCSGDAWKQNGTTCKAIADKYQSTCISSKKAPDGQRFMEYKVEEVGDAESFQDECLNLEGFTASFEAL